MKTAEVDTSYMRSMLSNRVKRFTAAAVCLIMLLAACGCSPISNNGKITSATSTGTAESSGYLPESRGPSGPLRVWWSTRSSLNPLLDNSLTGIAANKLIFDSLTEYNKDGLLVLSLAESISWSEDEKICTIKLKRNINFHDGKELTAADAAQSLAFVWSSAAGFEFDPESRSDISPPDAQSDNTQSGQTVEDETDDTESINDKENTDAEEIHKLPDLQSSEEILNLLTSIIVPDRYTLTCYFSEKPAGFERLLTFFVIPSSAWLNQDPMEPISGTGKYRMDHVNESRQLILTRVGADKSDRVNADNDGVETIVLSMYPTFNEAMKALESDQLDLVIIDSADYHLYYSRNNLTLMRYTANESVFLAAQTSSGYFSEQANLIALKKLLNVDNLRLSRLILPGEFTNMPLQNLMLQQLSATKAYNDFLDNKEVVEFTPWQGPEDSGVKVILPDLPQIIHAASRLTEYISAKLPVTTEVLSAEDFQEALESGSYDLAFCTASLPRPANPSWLYGNNESVKGIDFFTQPGLSGYDQNLSELSRLGFWWYKAYEADKMNFVGQMDQYGSVLGKTAALSPFCHLYMPYLALAYGDRVDGQSNPNQYDPYDDIEELWVWSGQ